MDKVISEKSSEIREMRNHIIEMESIIEADKWDYAAQRSWKQAHAHIKTLEREIETYIERDR